MGGYLGVKLALAGHPVSFLTRTHRLHTLRNQGLQLSGDGPPQALTAPSAYSNLAEAIAAENPDLILLTVKAYDVADAARSLRPLLKPAQTVVSFLNGVNNESTLKAELGPVPVLAATLTSAVQAAEDGRIQVERVRGIGLAGDHPLIEQLRDELQSAGFLVRHYESPERMKWSKLLTNIVSNASSAILGWSPSQVYANPQTAMLEIQALREAVRVMRALGYPPHNLPGVPVAALGRAIFLPAFLTRKFLGKVVGSGRGAKKPSLHHDIGRGRSEVGWLNGAVVSHAVKVGIPTPINRLLTDTLLDLVHNRRSPEDFMNKPQALLENLAD